MLFRIQLYYLNVTESVRWALAWIGNPPDMIMAGDGDLTSNHSEWTQDSKMWMLIYYHHSNALTIWNHTYALQSGDMAFVPPGAPCSHASVGVGHHIDFISFGFRNEAGVRAAIPHVARQMQGLLPNLRKASNRIVDTMAPCQAFIWNTLWFLGQSPSVFRERESLYVAEEFVRRHLDQKFTVGELADACKISPRALLTMFRQEHGMTVQEFVLQRRVQEASRLLLKTELSIKEVASRVGMHDLQYFNKTMRANTGLAPSRFRDKQS